MARWGFLTSIARIVTAHPWRVIGAVLVATAVAAAVGSSVQHSLRYGPSSFRDKSSESARVGREFQRVAGFHPDNTVIALVALRRRFDPRDPPQRLLAVQAFLSKQKGVGEVQSILNTGDRHMVSRNGRETFMVVGLDVQSEADGASLAESLSDRLRDRPWVRLGGPAVANFQFKHTTQDNLAKAEVLAFPLLLLLLIWLFRGPRGAILPLAVGGMAIIGALLGLRIVSAFTPLSVFALNFITGLGLGLAVDYALLMTHRFREELGDGHEPAAALTATMKSAGRTVLISSLTVTLALSALLVFPVPFLYSMGVGGVMVSALAGTLALVVLPPLLILLGRRMVAQGKPPPARQRSRFWARVTHRVVRHPLPVALVVGGGLLLLGSVALHARFTFADPRALPAEESARQVFEELDRSFLPYQQTPLLLGLSGRHSGKQLETFVRPLERSAAVAAIGPVQSGPSGAVAAVVSVHDPKSTASEKLVQQLRSRARGTRILVGGDTAALIDLKQSVRDSLLLALLIATASIFWLQLALTRSVILPLKTLLMAALTVACSFGVLVLVFQDGNLEGPLGFTSEGALGSTEPVVLLALVLALTSDYAAFVLARIREGHDSGLANRDAVEFGVNQTVTTVTGAAVVLAVAVGSFSIGDNIYVKELGLGVAVAVLLDATVIRGLLVPALMVLFGDWNWWLPGRRGGTVQLNEEGTTQ